MSEHEPTHTWVAEKIDYSIGGVSLLRSGKRTPTADVIELVEEVFDWPAAEQFTARKARRWAAEFNQVLAYIYENEEDGE